MITNNFLDEINEKNIDEEIDNIYKIYLKILKYNEIIEDTNFILDIRNKISDESYENLINNKYISYASFFNKKSKINYKINYKIKASQLIYLNMIYKDKLKKIYDMYYSEDFIIQLLQTLYDHKIDSY
jgi:hypothetical protein